MNKFLAYYRTILKTKVYNWCIFLSLSCTLLLFLNYFARLYDCPLNNFNDRSIGIAILSGIDASERTWVYIEKILAGIGIFIGIYICCALVNLFIQRAIRTIYISIEQEVLSILALFAIWLTLRAMIAEKETQSYFLEILLLVFAFVGLTFLIIFLKIFSYHGKRVFLRYVSNYSIIITILSLIYSLFWAGWVLLNGSFTFTSRHFVGFFLLVLIGVISYPIIVSKFSTYSKCVDHAFVISGIPLAAIPVSIPLANELQFTLSKYWNISPRLVSALIIGLLFVKSISIFIFLVNRTTKHRNAAAMIRNWYFPLFIVAMFLFNRYSHTMIFSDFNGLMLHLGETTLPTHQLILFKSLPFVNIFPTHALSDMFTQTLYSWVNGYRGIEMGLWNWITESIGVLLLYFLLARLTSPLFGLCVIIFTMSEIVYPSYFRMALLPALLITWVLKRPVFSRYALLWVSILWIGVWRYDFGIAAMAAMLFIMPVVCAFSSRRKQQSLSIMSFTLPLLSFFVVFVVSFLVYLVVIVVKEQSIIELLKQFWYYLKIQAPTQSYSTIFSTFTPIVVWQYLLFPIFSMAYVAFFVICFFFNRRFLCCSSRLILAYLAVFALIMSVRSVQRHSLMEGSWLSILSVFLLCMSTQYFVKIKKLYFFVIFLSVLYLSCLIFAFDRNGNLPLINTKRLFAFEYWYKQPQRVRIINETQYANLVRFCEAMMHDNQTFFELTNSPLLYVLANRRFPTYIIPNAYHTSEQIQQYIVKQLNLFLQQRQLPFVIFKHKYGWEADDVPNVIRSYRIAEFIYQHYRPFLMVDHYEIWKERDLKVPNLPKFEPLSFQSKEHFQAFDMIVQKDANGNIVMQSGQQDPRVLNVVDIGSGFHLHAEKQYALKLTYTSSSSGMLQLFYLIEGRPFMENEQDSTRISVVATGEKKECLILIPKSERPIWLRNIRFDPPSNTLFTIHRIEMIGMGDSWMPIINTMPQEFDLKKLPYIWGTYDEQHADHETPVLQTLALPKSMFAPNQLIEIPCNAEIDKTSGNYLHFKIRSDYEGSVTIRYGKQNVAQIRFDVIASKKEEEYLIRISTQWAWMSEAIRAITIEPSVPLYISQAFIRKGD